MHGSPCERHVGDESAQSDVERFHRNAVTGAKAWSKEGANGRAVSSKQRMNSSSARRWRSPCRQTGVDIRLVALHDERHVIAAVSSPSACLSAVVVLTLRLLR